VGDGVRQDRRCLPSRAGQQVGSRREAPVLHPGHPSQSPLVFRSRTRPPATDGSVDGTTRGTRSTGWCGRCPTTPGAPALGISHDGWPTDPARSAGAARGCALP
jgi:hypothetical protein